VQLVQVELAAAVPVLLKMEALLAQELTVLLGLVEEAVDQVTVF
jgi:hypothetical protein